MDIIRTITKGIDHNRWTVIGMVVGTLSAASILSLPGCQSKTVGLDGTTVTATQLDQQAIAVQADIQVRYQQLQKDIDEANEQLEVAYADIARQDAMKAKILELVSGVGGAIVNGTATPANTLPLALAGLSVFAAGGLRLDNKRKDIVIKEAKGTVA